MGGVLAVEVQQPFLCSDLHPCPLTLLPLLPFFSGKIRLGDLAQFKPIQQAGAAAVFVPVQMPVPSIPTW